MEYEQLAGKGRPNFITNTNLAGDKVLPLGGVIFKLNDQLSYYVSYTQSLKPTSVIAAFTSGFVVDSTIAPGIRSILTGQTLSDAGDNTAATDRFALRGGPESRDSGKRPDPLQ